MEVIEAIRTRRSIRRYLPDPVDEAVLETVLDAARWAPSWKNTQCWRFIVVRDGAVKAELAAALIQTRDADTATDNPALKAFLAAPVIIVACAELGRSGLNGGEFATDKGDWYMFDVALAMQNLALAAHSFGLGTVHVGQFDHEKVAEILGVPEGLSVVSMTPLGYPEREGRPPGRKELAEIVSYDRYGRPGH